MRLSTVRELQPPFPLALAAVGVCTLDPCAVHLLPVLL